MSDIDGTREQFYRTMDPDAVPEEPGVSLLSLDFEKAYDRPSRRYISRVLRYLKVPPLLCSVINASLSETKSQVIVNGFLGPLFPVKTGVRQGDPVSPLLFALMLELLLCYLRQFNFSPSCTFRYQSDLQFQAFWKQYFAEKPYPRLPGLNPTEQQLVAFADDVCIFLDEPRDARVAAKKLERFCYISRARINERKSMLIRRCELVPSTLRDEAAECFQAVPQLFLNSDPVTILGIRIDEAGAATQWKSLFSSMSARLRRFAFQGTPTIIAARWINTFVLSKIVYVAAVNAAPEAELKAFKNKLIETLRAGKRQGALRAENMVLPTDQGGFGLLDLDMVIRARQAYFWYILVGRLSYTRSYIFGFAQQRLLALTASLPSERVQLCRPETPNLWLDCYSPPLPLERLHAFAVSGTWPFPRDLTDHVANDFCDSPAGYALPPFCRQHHAAAARFLLPASDIHNTSHWQCSLYSAGAFAQKSVEKFAPTVTRGPRRTPM